MDKIRHHGNTGISISMPSISLDGRWSGTKMIDLNKKITRRNFGSLMGNVAIGAAGAGLIPGFISQAFALNPQEGNIRRSQSSVILLKASNGKYVSAEANGTQPLKASSDYAGTWERFTQIHLSEGKFALRASNGKYVTAENAGASSLIANRDAIGPWETFQLVDNGNTKAIIASVNNRYVTNESNGGAPLIANRDAIGPWESFEVITPRVDALSAGEILESNEALVSGNGLWTLAMQTDGNLVIYDERWAPLWASNTAGSPGARLFMQPDGNLVIYRADGSVAWASNTAGYGSVELIMQSDRNLVLYRADGTPTWASNTYIDANAVYQELHRTRDDYLCNRWTGEYIHIQRDIGYAELGPIELEWHSAKWKLVPIGNYVLIKNRWSGKCMHLERGLGRVEVDYVMPSSDHALWIKEDAWGYTRLKNKATGEYMHIENRLGYVQVLAGAPEGWHSSHWSLYAPIRQGTGILNTRRWQTDLPDFEPINRISLPGTHDSGALHDGFSFGFAKTQDATIKEQLVKGVRFLDIRCRHINDVFAIHHGEVFQQIFFGDVINQCAEFLSENQNQYILMTVKEEHTPTGNTRSFQDTLNHYIQQNPGIWFTGNHIPTVGEIRNRIVLINRYDTTYGTLGLNWSSQFSVQDNYEIPEGSIDAWLFDIPNYLSADNGLKWEWTRGKLDEAKSNPYPSVFYVSYASGFCKCAESIRSISEHINREVKNYFKNSVNANDKNFGCIVPMDFVDQGAINSIVIQALGRYGISSPTSGQICRLYNNYQHEYLYAADYAPYDNDRRRVFTWRPGNPVQQGDWLLEHVQGDVYRIYNMYQQEYLYAADYAPYDNDRRRVFTWRPGVPVAQGEWRLIKVGNGLYRIYNEYQQEYLYAADFAPYDNDRRRVFTWIPGQPVTQGDWYIEVL